MRHITAAENLPWCAVLDLQKTYDSVPRKPLFRLTEATLCTEIVAMISLALQLLEIGTKQDDSRTTETVTQGVSQGFPFSPILFNFLMDNLHDALHVTPLAQSPTNKRPAWQLTMFADYAKMQEDSPTTPREVLTPTNVWAIHQGMQWGCSKCFVMGPPGVATWSHLRVGQNRLQSAEGIDYRGVTVTSSGVSTQKNEGRLRKVSNTVHRLRRSGIHGRNL